MLPLSPNSRSKTTRGLCCVGSGVFWLFQEIVFVYGQANPVSQAPAVSLDSIASSSDASCVSFPISCARIWSIEMPASSQVSLVGGDTSVRKRVLAFACGAARPAGSRHAVEPAQHQHVLAERRERRKRRRQLEGRAFGSGR